MSDRKFNALLTHYGRFFFSKLPSRILIKIREITVSLILSADAGYYRLVAKADQGVIHRSSADKKDLVCRKSQEVFQFIN